jgi:hypothetical protein
MRKAWDHRQPVETLFKQIQDCDDFFEAGGVEIGRSQQINVGYAKIFATGNFMSACRRWNEKETSDKIWANFKAHFAAVHRQHKQMQGESAVNSGYHAANIVVKKTEDQMDEATIGALANLATATSTDRGFVATLTEANSRLARQLEDRSNELKENKALLKKERAGRKGNRTFNPSLQNYFWMHGYKVRNSHTSQSCNYHKNGHKRAATEADNMGGSQANKELCVGATSLNNSEKFEDFRTPPLLEHHETAIVDSGCT